MLSIPPIAIIKGDFVPLVLAVGRFNVALKLEVFDPTATLMVTVFPNLVAMS